jgi:hypothetical protein|tara:strand:- start:7070 stop:7732 length:663 start_codon:yes stop_codon:yes gene_type:complete
MPEKPVRVKSNFKMKSSQISRYARKLNKKYFRGAMFAALEEVGNTAVQNYIKQTTLEEAVGGESGSVLMGRTGRLAGSIAGAWRFSQANLPVKVESGMRKKIRQSEAGFEGGKKESIRKVVAGGRRIEGIIGSEVPYAAIHEYGGKTTTRVTPRARSYFWWAYSETGDEKWKGMALTSRDSFSRTIPERSYLRPAIKDAWPSIMGIFKRTAEETFKNEHI